MLASVEQERNSDDALAVRPALRTHAAIDRCLGEAVAAADDRRSTHRYPFFRRVAITPRGDECGELSAFVRDISPTGIGLFHKAPLALGEIFVHIPSLLGHWVELKTDVKWCLPAGHGWYFSGGRFATTSWDPVVSFLVAAIKAEANRRLRERYPFFRPIAITQPGGAQGEMWGFCRDLSPSGIGLLHAMPLESGQANIKVPSNMGDWVEIVTSIKWCKPTVEGWYLSGGTFVPLLFEELPSLLL